MVQPSYKEQCWKRAKAHGGRVAKYEIWTGRNRSDIAAASSKTGTIIYGGEAISCDDDCLLTTSKACRLLGKLAVVSNSKNIRLHCLSSFNLPREVQCRMHFLVEFALLQLSTLSRSGGRRKLHNSKYSSFQEALRPSRTFVAVCRLFHRLPRRRLSVAAPPPTAT